MSDTTNDPTSFEDYDEEPINTMNDWLLSTNGSPTDPTFMFILGGAAVQPFKRDVALRMAAWLATMADPGNREFPAVLAAVRNT